MRDPLAPQLGRPHASDAVVCDGVRRVARDGSLQQPCFAVHGEARPRAMGRTWPTGSAGEANNRSRRDSVSGQNAEPTSSARTKPGPSAMALNNRCRRRVLPCRASLFAEPARLVDHVGQFEEATRPRRAVGTGPYFFSITCTSNIWRVPSFASAGNAKRSPARFHVGAGSMRRSPPS